MQSGSELPAISAEKAAFEKLIEVITTTKDADILKFVEKLRKYLNHAQNGISFTPSKKITQRLGMLKDLWKKLKSSALLTPLGNDTLGLFEKDLSHNFGQLRQYFPKESEELDDLMSDLSRTLEEKTLPDAKLYVPGSIRSGVVLHFSMAKPLPMIKENEDGVRLFLADKADESIALFEESLEKLDALPHKGPHYVASLYEIKSNLAESKWAAAQKFDADKNYDKALNYLRDALITQEQVADLSLTPVQQEEVKQRLTNFRHTYLEAINKQIDKLADVDKEEEVILLLENIHAEETLKRESRIRTIDVKRRIAIANNRIGRHKCDINTVEDTVKFLNLAVMQSAEILIRHDAESKDTKFFWGFMENLYAFLLTKVQESIEQKNYTQAISLMLRILIKLNVLTHQNMSEKLIGIQKQTLAAFDQHLFSYFTQELTPAKITDAIIVVTKNIKHIPALMNVLNKTVASIAVIFAYAQFQKGFIEAAFGTLMLMSAEIRLESTVHFDNSYIIMPNHPLNDLLAVVVFTRDAFKPSEDGFTDRERDIAAISTRFIGLILLEQCKSFDVENPETYLPCFQIAKRACETFIVIGTENPIDQAYFDLCHFYITLMRTSLMTHMQNLVINLKNNMDNRIHFFNMQFSRNATQLPELFNLLSRLHVTQDIATLPGVINSLGTYLMNHPHVPQRLMLEEIHVVAAKLVTLNQLCSIGYCVGETFASNSVAPDDTAALVSRRP
jgi:hypothetical protein